MGIWMWFALSGSQLIVALGNSSHGFSNGNTYAVGSSPGMPVSADVNGDNNPDLLITNYSPTSPSISILYGNGDGTFSQPLAISLPSGVIPTSIAVGDLNNDVHADLVVGDDAGADGSF